MPKSISHGLTTAQPDNPAYDISADEINQHTESYSGLTAGHVMRASAATAADFAAIQDGDVPATIARDSEVTAAVAALSTVYQPLDSDLTAIAALSTTSFGRALLSLTKLGDLVTGFAADASLTGTEELYVNDAGTDKKVTANQVASFTRAPAARVTPPDNGFPGAFGIFATGANPTSGTFRIEVDGQITAALNYNDPSSVIIPALEALSSVDSGGVLSFDAPGTDPSLAVEGFMDFIWADAMGGTDPTVVLHSDTLNQPVDSYTDPSTPSDPVAPPTASLVYDTVHRTLWQQIGHPNTPRWIPNEGYEEDLTGTVKKRLFASETYTRFITRDNHHTTFTQEPSIFSGEAVEVGVGTGTWAVFADRFDVTFRDSSGTQIAKYSIGGTAFIHRGLIAAPADGLLNAGDFAIYFDPTDGAAKLKIKAKTSNGTVVTGSVNLA